MSFYKVDKEIFNAVKDTHNFDKILGKAKVRRQTFAKRIKELVKIKAIEKRPDGTYWLKEVESYEQLQDGIDELGTHIENIQRENEKYTDKKLLNLFIEQTIASLVWASVLQFHAALTPDVLARGMEVEATKKLFTIMKARALELERRDPTGKLVAVFWQTVKNHMFKIIV